MPGRAASSRGQGRTARGGLSTGRNPGATRTARAARRIEAASGSRRWLAPASRSGGSWQNSRSVRPPRSPTGAGSPAERARRRSTRGRSDDGATMRSGPCRRHRLAVDGACGVVVAGEVSSRISTSSDQAVFHAFQKLFMGAPWRWNTHGMMHPVGRPWHQGEDLQRLRAVDRSRCPTAESPSSTSPVSACGTKSGRPTSAGSLTAALRLRAARLLDRDRLGHELTVATHRAHGDARAGCQFRHVDVGK